MFIKTYPNCRYLIDYDHLSEQLDVATLLDLRPAEDFAIGHICGAKHLDIYSLNFNDTSPVQLEAIHSMFNGPLGSDTEHVLRSSAS